MTPKFECIGQAIFCIMAVKILIARGNSLKKLPRWNKIKNLYWKYGCLEEYYDNIENDRLGNTHNFAVVYNKGLPISIAYLRCPKNRKRLYAMAYTATRFRNQGYAMKAMQKLLKRKRLSAKRKIPVFNSDMIGLLSKIGYRTRHYSSLTYDSSY